MERNDDFEVMDVMPDKPQPKTRGLRNNNPCNIRKGSNWQGLDNPPDDGVFCRFTSMVYGFRAVFMLLHKYYYEYKLTTPLAIISRWAPEADHNKPYAYAKFVAAAIGKRPSQFMPYIDLFRWDWVHFVVAMAQVENGVNNCDEAELVIAAEKAWDMLFKIKS